MAKAEAVTDNLFWTDEARTPLPDEAWQTFGVRVGDVFTFQCRSGRINTRQVMQIGGRKGKDYVRYAFFGEGGQSGWVFESELNHFLENAGRKVIRLGPIWKQAQERDRQFRQLWNRVRLRTQFGKRWAAAIKKEQSNGGS